MASSLPISIPVEKLKGLEDYNHWKFTLKMILMHEDLFDCVTNEDVKDEKKKQKALAKICLSVGPSALSHVRNAKSPYEAWQNLERAYEDKGLCRRLGLLRSLFGMKLCETEGMLSYLSKITELGQQLSDIGSALDDEFLAVIMLSGLTGDFDPLIMALENSNIKLTSEVVKSKLLQEQQRRDDKNQEGINALAARKTSKIVCFKCKKPGHMKRDCTSNTKTYKNNPVQKSTGKTPEKSLLTALRVNLHGGFTRTIGA